MGIIKAQFLLRVVLLIGAARWGSGLAYAQPTEAELEKLVDQLGDPSPRVRQRAAEQLVAHGRFARAAVADAAQGDDPQLRAAAAQILLKIPFDEPDDPAGVRPILAAWGRSPEANRIAALRGLISVAGPGAPPVLLRLMTLDPSDRVRWSIVGHFRGTPAWLSNPPIAQFESAARQNRAPNAALLGLALEVADRPRALATYRRCVEIESDRPSDDGGEADFIFEALMNFEVAQRHYDAAAGVLRVQVFRRPGTEESLYDRKNRLDQLFLLHARYGPVKGFEDDVAKHESKLSRAPILYCIGSMYERRAKQPMIADAVYRAAFVSTSGAIEARDAAGEFLTTHRMDDLAHQELSAIVEMQKPPAGENPSIQYVNALLRLGIVHANLGDDQSAGESILTAMNSLSRIEGRILTRTRGQRKFVGKEAEDLMWAEIHWHFFRAARSRGDEKTMLAETDKLIELAPVDEHVANEVLPELVDRGQSEKAAKLFEAPFKALKARLDEKPDDPETLNNIAWLCARGAQRLEEAKVWSQKAMAARPDRYAYVDTAAEVEYRLGNFDRAIELETRAIELKPDDSFLGEQLKRFQAAKAKQRP